MVKNTYIGHYYIYNDMQILETLIQIKGRDDGPGRALLYSTSKEFLISFGIDKLSDLPKLKEINEIIGESNFDKQINAFK